MARLGFFSFPWAGHLNPLAALAGELERRGHETVFFHLEEFEPLFRRTGVKFIPYGEKRFEPGTFSQALEQIRLHHGTAAGELAMELVLRLSKALLEEAEPVVASANLDLWVIDQMDYAAATLARCLEARFVTAVVTLMKNDEPGVPGFDGQPYQEGPPHPLIESLIALLSQRRRQAGLEPFCYETVWSELAQVSQQPAGFEFPRSGLPECFHFTGPFARPGQREPVPFPWERLDGRPLVYISFGTIQHPNSSLEEALVEATGRLGVQVVLSLKKQRDWPEHVVAVPFAPQLEILARAAACIHHAGMNSTLECLTAGVPMLAFPIAHDQPGVAARIEWSGAGLSMPAGEHSVEAIAAALERLLKEPSFRERAQQFRRQIQEGRGLEKAADLVEGLLSRD